jgi:hypothetical protein
MSEAKLQVISADQAIRNLDMGFEVDRDRDKRKEAKRLVLSQFNALLAVLANTI